MTEDWRPIRGWEGLYDVSDLGRVRGLDRVHLDAIGRYRRWPGMILRPVFHDAGYPIVTLYRRKLTSRQYVHRLVASAFHGDPPAADSVVNHLNGVKTDNRPQNLEWTNHAGNMRHARETGLWTLRNPSHGEAHHLARLTESDVRAIRARYDAGESTDSIARDFPVTVHNIKAVAYRKTWRHVA